MRGWLGPAGRFGSAPALALAATFAAGCTGAASDAPPVPVVVVSIAPLAYAVERVAGNAVHIEIMIPRWANPHTYEPAIEQMRALDTARLLVEVGHPALPLERRWAQRAAAERPSLAVVSCAEGVALLPDDPHVWLSPAAMRAMLPRLESALTLIQPGRGARFAEGRARLAADIDRLDAEIRARLANVPGRTFWVFHPSWGYFARDYGLRQVAVEMGHKEPDAKRLGEVIAAARAGGAREIFVEPQSSRRMAELIASEIDARVVLIDPLAHDWLENLRAAAERIAGALTG